MKTQLIVAATTFLATALTVPAQDEKRSPELQVLDRFVGTWDIDLTYKPTGGEEISLKAVSHRTLSTRGTILHFDDPGQPSEPELQILLTYDPEARNYPGVMMSGPSHSELTGTWDEKTQTMSFTGSLADGGSFESTHRFIDADHADPKGVFKNAAGEVVAELGWKQTRRKKEKPLGAAPGVDELIASFHEAIGGVEANKKLTTRRLEGTVSFFGAPEPFKMTAIQKAPNLSHTTVVIPGLGEAFEGYDGKVAWRSNPNDGNVELEGEELAQKARDNQFHKYLDFKSEFKALESKGREAVNGKDYDVLEATHEDGSKETLYFDARTHLLGIVKRSEFSIEMSDYQMVDGVAISHTGAISTLDGTTILTFKLKSIKHGVKVDDALFARPKE